MQVIIFEDYLAAELKPVTLTRPALGVSMCGTNLYNLLKFKGFKISYIVRQYLRDFCAEDFPNHLLNSKDKMGLLFINASFPPVNRIIQQIIDLTAKKKPFLAESDSRVVCAFFPEISFDLNKFDERSLTNFLREQEYEFLEERFPLINYPFDIIRYNKYYFQENLQELIKGFKEREADVFVGKNVQIHPTACMDTEGGTIVVDDDTTISPFVYIKGPVYIGKNCKITERASIKDMCHIAAHCKVGGEVECSIMEVFSNKQHHGFLGHSWVGSWVNMGAGTSSSDLKNTYGEITINYQGKKIPTGMQFLGCIIGDYSKTAINTSIFTGKIIGAASYAYGFVTTNVPSFCNYARGFGQVTEHYLPAVVKTQERMFARRNVNQTRIHVKLLEDIYQMTRDERIMSTDNLSF
ncbi:glucose-1-phosphate thymidylyltransferase [Candidatus Aerophobetes bacterium]|nr:glucose-1-phosphate thymidylyltransferase [Candidatus Aerophobetes bacterium]